MIKLSRNPLESPSPAKFKLICKNVFKYREYLFHIIIVYKLIRYTYSNLRVKTMENKMGKLIAFMVEDCQTDTEFITRSLEAKFDIEFVTTLQAALTRLANVDDHYDLILLDMNLPDSRNVVFAVNTVKELTTKPILLMTGMYDEDRIRAGLDEGAANFFLKDDRPQTILEKCLWHCENSKIKQKLNNE